MEPAASEKLRVVASPHMFRVATHDLEISAGGTVLDLMRVTNCDRAALLSNAHVFIIDRAMTREPIYILRENWARVRPKPGMHVSIRVIPTGGGGGGGKSPARTLLTIAIMAASFAVPAAAAAGVFGEGLKAFALSGNLFGKFYLGSAALAIGTPIIGPVAINSTAPPSP